MSNPYGIELKEKNDGNPYGLSLNGEPNVAPVQEEKTPLEKTYEFLNETKKTTMSVVNEAGEAGVAAATGAIEGFGSMLEFPAQAGEEIGTFMRRMQAFQAEVANKALGTDIPKMPVGEFNEMSQWMGEFKNNIKSNIDELKQYLPDPTDDIEDRYIKTISNYSVQNSLISKALINKGARLLAASPKNPNTWQKFLMEGAKNPEKALQIEKNITYFTAAVGQTAEEMDASPTQRFVAELTASFGGGSFISAYKNLQHYLSKKFASGKKALSEEYAAKYLSDVVEHDPEFKKRLIEGNRLNDEYDMNMDVAQRSNNPELKSATHQLNTNESALTIREQSQLEDQTRRAKDAFRKDSTNIEVAQNKVQRDFDNKTEAMQKHVDFLEERAIAESQQVAKYDIEGAGEIARKLIHEAENVSRTNLDRLYGEIGSTFVGKELIRKGIIEGGKSSLGSKWTGRLSPRLKQMFGIVTGKNKGAFTINSVREFQSQLKSEIRAAREKRESGYREYVKSLGSVLDSTYKQLEKLEASTPVRRLKEANAAAKQHYDRFNTAEIEALTAVDLQGLYKVRSESILNKVVKNNSSGVAATTARKFIAATNNPAVSRDFLANAFAVKLKREAMNGNVLDHKKVAALIKSHSDFLKEAGIIGRFKNTATLSKKLQFAMDDMKKTVKDYSRDSLVKFASTDDPVKYVMQQISNKKAPSIIARLKREGDEVTLRGFREAAWEGMMDSAISSKATMSSETTLTVSNIRKTMDLRKKELIAVLGDTHYKKLNNFIKVIDRITPATGTARGAASDKLDHEIYAKLMTGLRAAAHGFVRPDLIFAQAGMRSLSYARIHGGQEAIRQALVDEDYLNHLLKLNKTREGRQMVQRMFSSLVPIATQSEESEN